MSPPARPAALVIHPSDNVAVALQDLLPGTPVPLAAAGASRTILIREPIPANHKFALARILPGGLVRKYGECIGEATRAISAGQHVHIHNLVSRRVRPGKSGTGGGAGRQQVPARPGRRRSAR